MKALFINPYLDTLGGGEKYILDISYALHRRNYEIYFTWPDSNIKQKLLEKFGTKYNYLKINDTYLHSNPFIRILDSRQYSVIFYQPDGSYPISLAKKNFALLQIPNSGLAYPRSFTQQLKQKGWKNIFNSHFVQRYFTKLDHRYHGSVLYPIVSEDFFVKNSTKKNYILSVGRFFQHLHSKKQEMLIKTFIFACKKYPIFKNYSLILAGNMKKEDETYVKYLKKLASKQNNISIQTNCSHDTVHKLYREARFYWHGAGYGESEEKHPERMEHFGISIVEAMASGAVVFAYKGGGPKETILHEKTGFLYSSRSKLIEYTLSCIQSQERTLDVSNKAIERAQQKFSVDSLTNSLGKLL